MAGPKRSNLKKIIGEMSRNCKPPVGAALSFQRLSRKRRREPSALPVIRSKGAAFEERFYFRRPRPTGDVSALPFSSAANRSISARSASPARVKAARAWPSARI